MMDHNNEAEISLQMQLRRGSVSTLSLSLMRSFLGDSQREITRIFSKIFADVDGRKAGEEYAKVSA